MSQELKMQAELNKVIANTETVANEELSDEQLDAVAGGILGCYKSKILAPICIFKSRIHSAQ
jgi:hypothetical protein